MKIFLVLILVALVTFSCSTKEESNGSEEDNLNLNGENLPNNVFLSGRIEGAINQSLTLEAQSDKGVITIGTTTVDQSGNFKLNGNINGMGIYQLRLGMDDHKVIPLTLEINDKVSLKANYSNFELLPVWSGTKWASPINKYMEVYNEFARKQMELSQNKSLSQEQQIKAFLELKKPVDALAKSEILKDLSNPANIVLSTSLTPAMGFEYWNENDLVLLKKIAVAFKAAYKDSPIANSMQNQAMEIEKAFVDYKNTKSGKKLAPEIALKNPEGKVIKLSSLRGQVVLVDFWASWCGPCRKENPNVVAMYNKYKNKGFTVYSVSLDKDAEAWKRAIKSDGLLWPNHVSDLMMWDTPLLQTYGFNSIPFTVLIGKDGNIIASNLRGESLEQKLQEVL